MFLENILIFVLSIRKRIDCLEEDFKVSFEDWLLLNQIPRELEQLENCLNIFTEKVSTISIGEFIKIGNAVTRTTPNVMIVESLFQVLSKENSDRVKTYRLIGALKSRREQFEKPESESSSLRNFFKCLNKCTK
jgi:hypothetical protein